VYLENDWIAPALSLDHLREMVRRSLEGSGTMTLPGKA